MSMFCTGTLAVHIAQTTDAEDPADPDAVLVDNITSDWNSTFDARAGANVTLDSAQKTDSDFADADIPLGVNNMSGVSTTIDFYSDSDIGDLADLDPLVADVKTIPDLAVFGPSSEVGTVEPVGARPAPTKNVSTDVNTKHASAAPENLTSDSEFAGTSTATTGTAMATADTSTVTNSVDTSDADSTVITSNDPGQEKVDAPDSVQGDAPGSEPASASSLENLITPSFAEAVCCVGASCNQSVPFGPWSSFAQCAATCRDDRGCVGMEYGNLGPESTTRCQRPDYCLCYLVKACSSQKSHPGYSIYLKEQYMDGLEQARQELRLSKAGNFDAFFVKGGGHAYANRSRAEDSPNYMKNDALHSPALTDSGDSVVDSDGESTSTSRSLWHPSVSTASAKQREEQEHRAHQQDQEQQQQQQTTHMKKEQAMEQNNLPTEHLVNLKATTELHAQGSTNVSDEGAALKHATNTSANAEYIASPWEQSVRRGVLVWSEGDKLANSLVKLLNSSLQITFCNDKRDPFVCHSKTRRRNRCPAIARLRQCIQPGKIPGGVHITLGGDHWDREPKNRRSPEAYMKEASSEAGVGMLVLAFRRNPLARMVSAFEKKVEQNTTHKANISNLSHAASARHALATEFFGLRRLVEAFARDAAYIEMVVRAATAQNITVVRVPYAEMQPRCALVHMIASRMKQRGWGHVPAGECNETKLLARGLAPVSDEVEALDLKAQVGEQAANQIAKQLRSAGLEWMMDLSAESPPTAVERPYALTAAAKALRKLNSTAAGARADSSEPTSKHAVGGVSSPGISTTPTGPEIDARNASDAEAPLLSMKGPLLSAASPLMPE